MIKEKIRTIPNWPKEGIMFRDITTLLKDPQGLKEASTQLIEHCKKLDFDLVAGIESRGFILGSIIAYELNKGFIPIRKKGKLPFRTIKESYKLEYGTDEIEIHEDAIQENQKILLIDDLIATGGTAIAAVNLIQKAKGIVNNCCFVIDLPELKGTKKLKELGLDVFSLVEFEGE
ncbi:adenine phosphoribosyltransferase [Candidatus Woesearchaeota archaeon]|nr:adenine phosphoribosyltransferase [Candidatus Woesearchaeota archaeon]